MRRKRILIHAQSGISVRYLAVMLTLFTLALIFAPAVFL